MEHVVAAPAVDISLGPYRGDCEARKVDSDAGWLSAWVDFQVDARINQALRDVATSGLASMPEPRPGVAGDGLRALTALGAARGGAGRISRDVTEGDVPAELKKMAEAHAGLLRVVEAMVGEVARLSAAENTRTKAQESTISSAAKAEVAKIETAMVEVRDLYRSLEARHEGALQDLRRVRSELSGHEESIQRLRALHAEHVDAKLVPAVQRLERIAGLSEDVQYKSEVAELFRRSSDCSNGENLTRQGERLEAGQKALASRQATTAERVDYLEKLLGDTCTTHEREVAACRLELKTFSDRMQMEERTNREARLLEELKAHHSSVQERLRYLENQIGDGAEKHARELEAQQARHAMELDAIKAFHGDYSRQLKTVSHAHTKHVELQGSQKAQYATLTERLDYLEKLLGDSAGCHAEELGVIRAETDNAQKAHAGLVNDTEKLAQLHAILKSRVETLDAELKAVCAAQERFSAKAALAEEHLALQERVDRVEDAICGHEQRYSKELEDMKKKHAKNHAALSDHKAQLETHHQSWHERVASLENAFGDSIDKHARELQAMKAKHGRDWESVASLVDRVGSLEFAHEDTAGNISKVVDELKDAHVKHTKNLELMQRAHKSLSEETAGYSALHTTLQERLEHFEGKIGNVAEGHARSLDKLTKHMDAHQKSAHTVLEEHRASLNERLDFVEELLGAAVQGSIAEAAPSGSVIKRLEHVEKVVGDSAQRHIAELSPTHSRIVESLARNDVHASLIERVQQLEQTMGSLADRHIDDRASTHQTHSSLAERLNFLQAAVEDAVDKHSRELDSTRQAHAMANESLLQHHTSVKERLDSLENSWRDSAERHWKECEELKAHQTKHANDVSLALKSHTMLDSNTSALEAGQIALKERVNFLDSTLSDLSARLSQELATLKKGQARQSNNAEEKADAIHASLRERMDIFERMLEDSEEKHGKHAKELQTFKTHHASLARDLQEVSKARAEFLRKDTIADHHASLIERVNSVERLCGNLSDKHARELDVLRKSHSQHSINERLERRENLLGDAAPDSHGQEIDVLKRIVNKHAREMEALSSMHAGFAKHRSTCEAQHSSLLERVDALEHNTTYEHVRAMESQHNRVSGRLHDIERQRPNSAAKFLANAGKSPGASISSLRSSFSEPFLTPFRPNGKGAVVSKKLPGSPLEKLRATTGGIGAGSDSISGGAAAANKGRSLEAVASAVAGLVQAASSPATAAESRGGHAHGSFTVAPGAGAAALRGAIATLTGGEPPTPAVAASVVGGSPGLEDSPSNKPLPLSRRSSSSRRPSAPAILAALGEAGHERHEDGEQHWRRNSKIRASTRRMKNFDVGKSSANGPPKASPKPRPLSSPTYSAAESPSRSTGIPSLSQAKIDALVVDKERQRTHPPQLRQHLQLHQLLKGGDYKRCIGLVNDCFKQAEEGTPDETAEEAAARMSAAEVSLVGQIEDADVRQVLLLWIMGASLEACGEVRTAIIMFSRCVALDPKNPVHAYHRGVCMLRAGVPKSACTDLDLAVDLCREQDMRIPLAFFANRALAGSATSERMPEVWADFELVRHRCNRPPDSPQHLVVKAMDTYEDYKEMISHPVGPDAVHRHWVAVLVTRCCMRYEETVSDLESLSFVRFLRGLPGMASMTGSVVMKRFPEFSIRSIAEGQVLLLENYWYCILDGTIDVVRFGRRPPPGEAARALNVDRHKDILNKGNTGAEVEDPLRMPKSLEEVPELQVVETLPELTTLRGGDTFGPLKDGWLVAGEHGVELLCLKLSQMKNFEYRCGGLQAQVEADVKLLGDSPLFKSCPSHVLLTMVSELFEKREALCGEDPLSAWPGLVVIRKGQLQLFADPSAKSSLGSSRGSLGLTSSGGSSPRTSNVTEELCVLGPGDALGEEKLLGGSPSIPFTHSQVLSHCVQAWVLPQSKVADAEDIGLLLSLKENRDATRKELQDRAKVASTWARLRPRALAFAKTSRRTIDYVRGEVDPAPKPRGGVVPSWSER